MSIQSTIARELSKKYQGREKLLAPKSDKTFNGIFLAWFMLGYILGCIILSNETRFSECVWCLSIASNLPSIEILSAGSRYPDTMHYVWLFYILTAPIVLIVLFIFVTEFNRRVIQDWAIVLLIALCMAGIYVCYVGMEFGGQDEGGRFSHLYYKYLFYSTLVALAFNAMIVASIFHIAHHFIGVYRKESLYIGENHE